MSHSLQYTVNCSLLFTELPRNVRPEAVRSAGFSAVEFWWPFAAAVPTDAEVEDFVRSIDNAGVQLTGLNFFAGDMPGGDRGVLSSPKRAAEFRDNLDVVVDIGRRLGVPAFNALYGKREDGIDPAEQDAIAMESLLAAAEAVAAIDGIVLIEPVSGSPEYPLHTAADALAVVRAARERGAPNVSLLADFFHLAVNGDDLDTVVAQHAAEFGHIQIADHPGRGEPGTGDLPLDDLLSRSQAGGYSGWVGLEYKPTTPSVDSFDWLGR